MTDKTKEFLRKIKDAGHWNDNYDYSKAEYIDNKKKVLIIDRRFNTEHLITPNDILSNGTGCGIKNLKHGKWPYEEAKNYVHTLGLKNIKDWENNKSNLPHYIPKNAPRAYDRELKIFTKVIAVSGHIKTVANETEVDNIVKLPIV